MIETRMAIIDEKGRIIYWCDLLPLSDAEQEELVEAHEGWSFKVFDRTMEGWEGESIKIIYRDTIMDEFDNIVRWCEELCEAEIRYILKDNPKWRRVCKEVIIEAE